MNLHPQPLRKQMVEEDRRSFQGSETRHVQIFITISLLLWALKQNELNPLNTVNLELWWIKILCHSLSIIKQILKCCANIQCQYFCTTFLSVTFQWSEPCLVIWEMTFCTIYPQNMAMFKKKKGDNGCHIFQEWWTENYFFIRYKKIHMLHFFRNNLKTLT